MATLRFTTAGESHGPGLVAVVEGLPAGLAVDRAEDIDRDLARRQLGHGRGGRMKIESDRATVWAGIRHGRTLGSPVALLIENRDHANWAERMNPWPVEEEIEEVHLPRPGHADLAGVLKYGHTDVRNVLERASARETAARVAAGALAKAFLRQLGVTVHSHVLQIGSRDGARAASPPAARTSRASTSRPCGASTPRRRPRWWPRSTPPARPTRASAGCSRCAHSESCPGSAPTCAGTSASTPGSPRR